VKKVSATWKNNSSRAYGIRVCLAYGIAEEERRSVP